jgi:hypothetical protein
MTLTRAELTTRVDALDAALPGMIADYPDESDFWSAFAGEAEVIEDRAHADDFEYLQERIDAMLMRVGKTPD